MKLEEKKIFQLRQIQNPFFFARKVVGHFCNFQGFFMPTNALKCLDIAND